jgi:putative salt-induced outer membrane protein YdiY
MRKQALFLILSAVAFSGAAYADGAPCDCTPATPAADVPDWAVRALAGYAKTSGTSDTTSANALFRAAHTWEDWKFLFGAQALYGSTQSVTSAQDIGAEFQANYNISPNLFWFGGVSYDDNKFSGFVYQEMIDTGVGYQIINDADTKLSAQVGIGEQRLQTEQLIADPNVAGHFFRIQGASTSNIAATGAINFTHAFNPATSVFANLGVVSSSADTVTTFGVGLQVKMNTRFSLAAAYQVVNNSKVPAGVSKSNGLTTLNLVYELKNPKLAPQ